MTWGTYLLRLLVSGGAFTGVVALALAARGNRGWWTATMLGAAALAGLGFGMGERGLRLAVYLASLLPAVAVAALVVRWRADAGRKLLMPWALGVLAFGAVWIAMAVLVDVVT